MRTALLVGAVCVVSLSACGDSLTLTHSETPCVRPGQTVTLHTHTKQGSTISYVVQDDFGGTLGTIPPTKTDASGDLSVMWTAPAHLSTTTLHFLLTARNGNLRTARDIHVIVGGNGRSC